MFNLEKKVILRVLENKKLTALEIESLLTRCGYPLKSVKLITLLRNLENNKLIKAESTVCEDDNSRRYYSLTAEGLIRVQQEQHILSSF